MLLLSSCLQPQGIKLIQNNTSTYDIVIPQGADTLLHTAAKEIQHYLTKISTAFIPIHDETSKNKQHIYIGTKWLNDQRKEQVSKLSDDGFLLYTQNIRSKLQLKPVLCLRFWDSHYACIVH